MKQEERNKEAIQYAQDLYSSDTTPLSKYKIAQIHAGRDGFIAGAKWEKNRAWHYTTDELPEINKHVVNGDWFDFVAKDENDLKRIMKQYPFSRWAYVEDLLPDEED